MSDEQATLCPPEATVPSRPEGACVNWADCGNMTPGETATNNMMCDSCLDAARSGGAGLETDPNE
nr:hypothetical protein 28 [bacterium]